MCLAKNARSGKKGEAIWMTDGLAGAEEEG